tara:strand:+ start:381 stop:1106 length:726 start_codon:yes stop_codon:yes gene_type:complete
MQPEYLQKSRALMWLFLSATLCPSAISPAYSDSLVVANREGDDFFESVQKDVSVSGTVIVGIAAAGAQSGPATLAGLVLQTTARMICLTTQSRDGVYYSRNSYSVPLQTDAATLIQLPYKETKQPDLILGYEQGDLAVQTTPGSCEQGSNTYLIAARDQNFDSVELLINGFGATAVFYRTLDGVGASCTEFLAGRRTSYDYQCSVPVSQLDQGRQVILIERERYGRPLGSVEVEVQLGPEA